MDDSSRQAHAVGPLFVIFNPRSGRHDTDDDLPSALRGVDRPHRLFTLDRHVTLGDAIATAVAEATAQGGILVAAGGDGTINAVAQAALEADLPFAVVPRGTFNYFARLHRLPLEPVPALRVILGGRVVPTPVGLVNGRIFLVNASVGLYPKLLEDRERFKREYGRTRWTALWAGLVTLSREQLRMSLRIESVGASPQPRVRVVETSTLFVGNNELQLEQVGVAESRVVGHGMLAVLTIRPMGRLAMFALALRGALGRLGEDERVETFAVEKLEVEPRRRRRPFVKVATDGESHRMPWPLTFEVSPRPLRLIVP